MDWIVPRSIDSRHLAPPAHSSRPHATGHTCACTHARTRAALQQLLRLHHLLQRQHLRHDRPHPPLLHQPARVESAVRWMEVFWAGRGLPHPRPCRLWSMSPHACVRTRQEQNASAGGTRPLALAAVFSGPFKGASSWLPPTVPTCSSRLLQLAAHTHAHTHAPAPRPPEHLLQALGRDAARNQGRVGPQPACMRPFVRGVCVCMCMCVCVCVCERCLDPCSSRSRAWVERPTACLVIVPPVTAGPPCGMAQRAGRIGALALSAWTLLLIEAAARTCEQEVLALEHLPPFRRPHHHAEDLWHRCVGGRLGDTKEGNSR